MDKRNSKQKQQQELLTEQVNKTYERKLKEPELIGLRS